MQYLYDMLVIRLATFVKEVIQEFLDSEEDYLIAVARLEKERPGIPIKEVERRLGLAD